MAWTSAFPGWWSCDRSASTAPGWRVALFPLAVSLLAAGPAAAQTADAGSVEWFESRIRPLLAEHCYECHSADAEKLRGSLRVDGRSHLLAGGDSGPAVTPGDPEASRLIKAVRYLDEDTAMPPKQRLGSAQIADLETWVRLGAPWPDGDASSAPQGKSGDGFDWAAARASHWAFRPMASTEPPGVSDPRWNAHPIDRFVRSRLEQAGLSPAPAADRATLIRRASLDLIGLPPTPDEIEAFLRDESPEAFARVVDRLLASPRYGERWARHWLDVARYSDGLGGFLDAEPLPEAWRYRDWVIEALNRDLPYDAFLRAQIAGDLDPSDPTLGVATGFFAVGPTYISDGGDPEAQAQARAETLADRVDTFSRAFLGLTVACARCHDHKSDPITTRDYYALAGIFNNTSTGLRPAAPAEVVAAFDSWRQSVQALEKSLADAEKDEAARGHLPELRESLNRLHQTAPPEYPRAHQLAESGNADMPVAIRGDLRKPGEPAPRRFLQIIAGDAAPAFRDGSGRRELAAAVTDPANPLTARVLVNRVWKHHFGEALVRTPSNFGPLGETPTHPELLDWLALDFIKHGWSLKRLHRLILLSSAWQMSSRFHAAAFERDGDNRLLWRMNPRRLEVEAWRDSLLAVTGELDLAVGGPPAPDLFESNRRTLYATISRNGDRHASDEFLRLFDFPAPRTTSESRAASTVPQQYLFMLNSGFMQARARALSGRLHLAAADDHQRLNLAYRLLYGRPPEESESRLGLEFLATPGPAETRWEEYAQVLLSAHEFRQIQ